MGRSPEPEDQESDDEYNAQETLNLLNLIKRDLEEDDDKAGSFFQPNTQSTPIITDDKEHEDNTSGYEGRYFDEHNNHHDLKTLTSDNHNGGDNDIDRRLKTSAMVAKIPDVNEKAEVPEEKASQYSKSASELTTKTAIVEPSVDQISASLHQKDDTRISYEGLIEESRVDQIENDRIDEGDGYSIVSEIEFSEASNEHHTNTFGLQNGCDGGRVDDSSENLTENNHRQTMNDIPLKGESKIEENKADAICVDKEDLQQHTNISTKPDISAMEEKRLCERLHDVQVQMEEERKKYNDILQLLKHERMEKEKLKNSLQTLLSHYYDKRNTEDQLKYLVSNIEEDINTVSRRPSHAETEDSVDYNYYKREILQLKERLRNAESSNGRLEEELRSSVLKERTHYQLDRTAMEDEIETQRHKISENDVKCQQLLRDIEQMKSDLKVRTEQYKATQISLQKSQLISDQRKGDLDEATGRLAVVAADLEEMKKRMVEKDEEMVRLQTQLRCKVNDMVLQREEVQKLRGKASEMDKVKVKYKELKIQVKRTEEQATVRGEKVKLLKKHMKQVQEENEEVEKIAKTVPELQRKIAHLQEIIGDMKKEVLDKQMEEEEQRRKRLREEEEEKEKVENEKKEWEKRVLGMGRCWEEHEEPANVSSSANTSVTTTPLFKPRPPSGQHSTSLQRKVILLPSSLPLNYLEERRSPLCQHINNHQQGTFKPIITRTNMYKRQKSGKRVPTKLTRPDHVFIPRVLEWGDGGLIDQALAVGNQVLCHIRRECSSHGNTSQQSRGVIRFIGFVKDNEEDVYIGVRLEEGGIGWTDGIVDGQRYFKCEKDRGVFVRLADIVEKVDSLSEHLPQLQTDNDLENLVK